jgi:hypothetical protein
MLVSLQRTTAAHAPQSVRRTPTQKVFAILRLILLDGMQQLLLR